MAPDLATPALPTCLADPDMPTSSSSASTSATLRHRPTASLRLPLACLLGASLVLSGCAVVAVADAAVTVAATAVKVTATVVETTVDVAAAGVRAATKEDEPAPGAEPAPTPAQMRD